MNSIEEELKQVRFRPPETSDGGRVFRFIDSCAGLELNSVYCYALLCTDFRATSVIAEGPDGLLGFAGGYRPPDRPDVLFIWQIGVHRDGRGRGIAGGMLNFLLERQRHAPGPVCNYLEATVAPDNAASFALFAGLARRRDVGIEKKPRFEAGDFAPVAHDPEWLVRVGPLKHSGAGQNETEKSI